MDGYLSKPIDPRTLYAVVEEEAGAREADAAAAPVPGVVTFDEHALLRRVSGDTVLMAEVIRLFLDDCPTRLAAIADAVGREHAVDLRAAAHALKGAAANLSALNLVQTLDVLERVAAESHMNAAEGAWRQVAVAASLVVDTLRRHPGVIAQEVPCVS
jgi:HPt (histidine-containing phosphotransfer) domain-containing protein